MYRLYHCLCLNKIEAELTARLRGDQVKKTWEKRLPFKVDEKCLIFQGAHDIIIKGKDRGTSQRLHMWVIRGGERRDATTISEATITKN